jgi:hypothetical protein
VSFYIVVLFYIVVSELKCILMKVCLSESGSARVACQHSVIDMDDQSNYFETSISKMRCNEGDLPKTPVIQPSSKMSVGQTGANTCLTALARRHRHGTVPTTPF